MKEYGFKTNLHDGRLNLGIWLTCTDLMVCDIVCHLGYDFVLVDTEHSFMTIESLRDVLMIARRSDSFPIVRVGWNDLTLVKQVLDAGAEGIIVPMVCNKEQAEKAVSYCRYPPQGVRGLGPLGASDFGRCFEEYVAEANNRIFVAVQIEHIDAVNDLDEIMGVSGLDGVFVGPADLAASLGFINNISHPQVKENIRNIIEKASNYGIPVGFPAGVSAEQIKEQMAGLLDGVRFLTVGSDMTFLSSGARKQLLDLKALSRCSRKP